MPMIDGGAYFSAVPTGIWRFVIVWTGAPVCLWTFVLFVIPNEMIGTMWFVRLVLPVSVCLDILCKDEPFRDSFESLSVEVRAVGLRKSVC